MKLHEKLNKGWKKFLKEAVDVRHAAPGEMEAAEAAAGTVPYPKMTKEEQIRLVDTAQEIFAALHDARLSTEEEEAMHAVEGYLVGNEDFPEKLKEPLRDIIKQNVELYVNAAADKVSAAAEYEKQKRTGEGLPKEIWPEEEM